MTCTQNLLQRGLVSLEWLPAEWGTSVRPDKRRSCSSVVCVLLPCWIASSLGHKVLMDAPQEDLLIILIVLLIIWQWVFFIYLLIFFY